MGLFRRNRYTAWVSNHAAKVLEMADLAEELLKLADEAQTTAMHAGPNGKMKALETAAKEVGKAWSGSSLGYHASVYYDGLRPAPPGAHFSQEWGLMRNYMDEPFSPGYVEYDPQQVKDHILNLAGDPDLDSGRKDLEQAARTFDRIKGEAHSILLLASEKGDDPYLKTKLSELEKIRVWTEWDAVEALTPGQGKHVISRDMQAINQGSRASPHLQLAALPAALAESKAALEELEKVLRQAGSHLTRRQRSDRKAALVGTNIFVGHGRSAVWRDLKDFISERLKLPYDEFNRVPVAGVTNIVRLSEMLDSAVFAFLVLTAEDETADGEMQARMNVIHEVGLFQGRLGFSKAIVLLEEGCKPFSNIEGLGQIRFPKGNITQVFEEIRRVLEREGIITSS